VLLEELHGVVAKAGMERFKLAGIRVIGSHLEKSRVGIGGGSLRNGHEREE